MILCLNKRFTLSFQVLAKFTLRVKYSVLEKGKLLNKTVPLDESIVEYYVVFEKRNDDRHAKWIIVERVRHSVGFHVIYSALFQFLCLLKDR